MKNGGFMNYYIHAPTKNPFFYNNRFRGCMRNFVHDRFLSFIRPRMFTMSCEKYIEFFFLICKNYKRSIKLFSQFC